MVHASGKFVPSIVSFISTAISEEQKEVLTSYQVNPETSGLFFLQIL
jgi:hypothetical protein